MTALSAQRTIATAGLTDRLGRQRPDGESESRRLIGFPGKCPVTTTLQSLPGRISTGSYGR